MDRSELSGLSDVVRKDDGAEYGGQVTTSRWQAGQESSCRLRDTMRILFPTFDKPKQEMYLDMCVAVNSHNLQP